jgi:hypothetical protein
MAQLNKSTYKALYGSTGTTFPDNTTEEISEGDMRQFGEDQADSFMSINDNFIDEDSFASDSATKAPSQQSTKAYVTDQIATNGGILDTDIKYFEQDEFLYHNSVSMLNARWQNGNAATGGTLGVDLTENAIGLCAINTTTSSTGVGYITKSNNNNTFLIGGGFTFKLRFRLAIETLSDGTDTFIVSAGFHDLPSASGNGTDGLFFRYTHGVNSGKWQAVTRVGGVETASDTGVSPAASVYQILDVRVNGTGTSATFYINGTLTNTITTNIPTGASNMTNVSTKIEKTVGTSVRAVYIDFFDMTITRTTAR